MIREYETDVDHMDTKPTLKVHQDTEGMGEWTPLCKLEAIIQMISASLAIQSKIHIIKHSTPKKVTSV